MKGGSVPEPEATTGNLDADELSTNQEAVAVPVFCGEAKFPLRWLDQPSGQFTREAPAERPGKK